MANVMIISIYDHSDNYFSDNPQNAKNGKIAYHKCNLID